MRFGNLVRCDSSGRFLVIGFEAATEISSFITTVCVTEADCRYLLFITFLKPVIETIIGSFSCLNTIYFLFIRLRYFRKPLNNEGSKI